MSPAPHKGAWVALFLPFALGYYLSYLLRTVNAVISPDLTAELALSAADLGLLTSAYFMVFALAQIPVGIALDRFGPRRVNAALLLMAALGAALFASGETRHELGLARALIGLGVSACLMSGLKAFSLWFPPARQSSMTGYIMAAGALGALTAATPVEAVLPFLGWRGVFWGIAGVCVAAAVFVWRCVPEMDISESGSSVIQTVRSLGEVFGVFRFWRFAGCAFMITGSLLALQSLWAVPWLMQVDGFSRAEAAGTLFLLGLGNLIGQLSIGVFGSRLAGVGMTPERMVRAGYCLVFAIQVLIVLQVMPAQPMWFMFGLLAAINAQVYVAAASHFPREYFGRVSAAVNLMVFVGAFIVQWGFGVLLDVQAGLGHAEERSLVTAFCVLLVLQAMTLVVLFLRPRGGVQAN